MNLDGIIGNQNAVRALKGMVESGRIPHAMMFYENDGCGAMALVLSFLSEVFKDEHKVSKLIHPDVHYVYPVANGSKVNEKVDNLRAELFLGYWRDMVTANPYFVESEVSSAFGIEGKQAGINNAEAKEILETIYLSPVEGGYKAVVIYLPEKMNAASANRLLKAVEEPPEKTLFLMVTHAPEKVMQTISSRCQAIRVLPYSKDEIAQILERDFGKDASQAHPAAMAAGGSVGVALQSLSELEDDQDQKELFRELMGSLSSHDLPGVLACGDAMAALSSREKQKAFCKFAGECLRNVFLLQQNLPSLAGIPSGDEAYFTELARNCRKSFPRLAMTSLDRAQMLIDRNVNQKVLFCDLVGRLYMNY